LHVIEEFLSSWTLFQSAYLAGWLIAALLGVVGVLVVARDQIFLGAAVSQASMLGLTVGVHASSMAFLATSDWYEIDIFTSIFGGAFAVAGALITVRVARWNRASQEAITGWIFAFGMSLSVLLVAHSPHGLEEVQRLLASTLIGATSADVWVFAALLLVTATVLLRAWRTLALVVMDPEMARALGVPVVLYERLLYVWLGIGVAFSLRVSGLVYTFGCLVLPALFAKSVCRDLRSMLFVAPIVALASAVVGFVLAHHYDLPPAHVVVVILATLVAVGWVSPTVSARQPTK